MAIKFDVPMTDYLAMVDHLSSGVAFRAINDSPIHALASRLQPRDPSTVSYKGEVIHRMLLEGHENAVVQIDADNYKTKAAQQERDAAAASGRIPILKMDFPRIRAAVVAAQNFVNQSEIAGIFDIGNPEVTVDWEDNGVLCRARPDYLTADWHISVKTTNVVGGANPRYWTRRQLSPMGYDFGLSFYKRGLLANGADVQHRFLVIEQNFPYGCSLIGLDSSKWAVADADVDRAIKLWRKCQDDNNFPGYLPDTFFAEASPWEIADAEEREYAALTV